MSVQSSQGVSAVDSTNDVTAALGEIAAGANASVTVVVRPMTTGPIVNVAMVGSSAPDPNIINNSAAVYAYIAPAPAVDVAVAIEPAPVPAGVGLPFSYLVSVGNPGTAPATGVTLIDILPDAASIGSIKPSQGTYTLAGNVLTVHFGALPVGGLAEVTIGLVPGALGYIVDLASVDADQPEFVINNNYASVATPVAAQAFPPAIIDQKLGVSGNKITSVLLTFNEALDADSANNLANYAILNLGSQGSLSATGPKVAIGSVRYNPTTRGVLLTFAQGLSIGRFYKVVVNGPGAPGLVDTAGNVLDGEGNGLQNSIYESLIGRGTTTRPVALQVGVPKPKVAHKVMAKAHHR